MAGCVALALASCGGKAVVDGTPGTGGEGGTATASPTTSGTTTWTTTGTGTGTTSGTMTGTTGGTTTGTTPGTPTGGSCEALGAELQTRLAAALACNPTLSVEQCTGEAVVYDTCGCSLAANALYPELTDAALWAYQVWVDAGCGPWDCYWCPPGPPAPFYCEGDPSGQNGMCVSAVNDY